MYRRLSPIVLALTAAAASAQTAPPVPATPAAPDARARNAVLAAPLPAAEAALKSHVMFLASDALKGREAGSAEFDIAAQYVAAQFYAAGLRPAGDEGGYLQKVPLVSYRLTDAGKVSIGGAPLVFGTDYMPVPNPAAKATAVAGRVVFVGQGVVASRIGRDDYAGVDVRGAIVAMLPGSPAALSSEERAFFGRIGNRAKLAADRGAIGVIELALPRGTKAPAKPAVLPAARVTWATPEGVGASDGAPVLATLTSDGAAKLFAGARTPWTAVVKAARARTPVFRAEALAPPIAIATTTAFTAMASANVAGMIPGTDPAMGKQVVILSAHLDHIGVSEEDADGKAGGDRINNGALDDAVGIASLIEEAKRFKAAAPPRRSILFLAVTAEEKGLVGSDYFAQHPTVPRGDIVADVNLDMPILTYKFEDVVAFGGDRSTLGPAIARAAAAVGAVLSPDPIPDQAIFVRSDHFRFVQQGIPSIFLWPGYKGPGRAASEHFLSSCYHKPCDDLMQPILWDQGVRFVDLNYRIAREIADADARPVWNKGDYFGTLFGGPVAQ